MRVLSSDWQSTDCHSYLQWFGLVCWSWTFLCLGRNSKFVPIASIVTVICHFNQWPSSNSLLIQCTMWVSLIIHAYPYMFLCIYVYPHILPYFEALLKFFRTIIWHQRNQISSNCVRNVCILQHIYQQQWMFCQKYILQQIYQLRATNSSEKWVYKPRQILCSWLKQNIASPRQSLWETCKSSENFDQNFENFNLICLNTSTTYWKFKQKYDVAQTRPLGNMQISFWKKLIKTNKQMNMQHITLSGQPLWGNVNNIILVYVYLLVNEFKLLLTNWERLIILFW